MRTGVLIAVGAALGSTAAMAGENGLPGSFTANAALTSDYVFRGVSQSNNRPAIQGGFDWDSGAGFHFGAWASSVNFKDGGEAHTEIDLTAGYGGKVDALSYDAGVIYYAYPGAARALNYDLWEAYGKAGYDFGPLAVNLGVNYSPDNFGGTGDATYISGGVSVPITAALSVSAALNRAFLETADYTDWNIGAKLNANGWFAVDTRYYDTDIGAGCVNPAGRRTCDSRCVMTFSRTF